MQSDKTSFAINHKALQYTGLKFCGVYLLLIFAKAGNLLEGKIPEPCEISLSTPPLPVHRNAYFSIQLVRPAFSGFFKLRSLVNTLHFNIENFVIQRSRLGNTDNWFLILHLKFSGF